MKVLIVSTVAGLLAAGGPAWAGANRVWVSGHGADAAGCGAPTAPCRSLQYAHDHAVNAGGEIDILDPAGYGALTITKAVSIVNDGVGTAGVQASTGNAITINAGPFDAIYLKGLNIDGQNAGAANGVDFVAGQRLVIDHCVVRHFSTYGVVIEPAGSVVQFEVRDSAMSDNHFGFVVALPSGPPVVTGVLDHVSADGNAYAGIAAVAGGGVAEIRLTISNSDASDNGTYGISAQGAPNQTDVEVNNSTMSSNGSYGFWLLGDAVAHVARSVIEYNGQAGIFGPNSSAGGILTAGDNHIEDNGLQGAIVGLHFVDTLY